MINKKDFDPEVYEFYKAAIDSRGFAVRISAADIERLREAEVTGHAAHTDPYEVYEKHDIAVERKSDGCACGEVDGRGSAVAGPLLLRVYVPQAARAAETAEERLPVLLYFHGGGFIMGSIEDHDPLCGKLADECGAVVIAPEYRLAPEHPFPACIEDAVFTAEWAAENAAAYGGDPRKLMAGGDSSGANIAAVLALLGRDGKAPKLSGLILLYGVYGCIPVEESGSGRLYGDGSCVLPLDALNAMMRLYVPEGTDPGDIRLKPGRAEDLSDMPPSVIVTAEFDPLRDDGEEFARRLEAAGSEVHLIRMDGMMHGFAIYWQRFSRAAKLLEDIGRIVKTRSQGLQR